MFLYIFDWISKNNELEEFFKINIIYDEFIIIVIIVDFLIKFKIFSLDTSLAEYRKIINNLLIMIIRNIIRNKGLDCLIMLK